jgi:hypothetical protein
LNVTESPSTAASSCITIASAPCGIGAPVKIRAAVPASSGLPTAPAMIFCATLNFFPGATSARRTAYPSIALLSIDGTSIVERCARASTRFVASRVGTSSTSATGLALARSFASASSTERSPWFIAARDA